MPKQNKIKLFLGFSTFMGFLIAMDPHTSGIAVHEWLPIALAGAVVVHLLLNWSWIAEVTSRLFSRWLNGARVNYVLNWFLFVDGVLIMLSGIMISESVVPALGITLSANFSWRSLHDLSANISLILMGLHVALHWNWIVNTIKRLFVRGDPAATLSFERKDAQA